MNNWGKAWEILSKKIPMVIAFIFASLISFCFIKDIIVGWMCAIIAIVHSFLIIKIDHYENIIKQKDNQIEGYDGIKKIGEKNIKDTLKKYNGNDIPDETKIN